MDSTEFDTEKVVFRQFYDAIRVDLESSMQSFKTLIHSLLKHSDISLSDIDGRIKDREECINKFIRKYKSTLDESNTPYSIKDNITDIIGIRIVCLYEDDIDRIYDILKEQFEVIDVTDKKSLLEGTETSFGYKGLHLDLKLNTIRATMLEYSLYKDYRFELQIRTVVQDSWSIIDHKIKYKKSIPNSLKRRINTLAALFELADREFRAIRDETKNEEINSATTSEEVLSDTEISENNETKKDSSFKERPRRIFPILNAFNFNNTVKIYFPDYELDPTRVDNYTQKILDMTPNISRPRFHRILDQTFSKVLQYNETRTIKMSPFGIISHCLYMYDKNAYGLMISSVSSIKFDNWLNT